MVRLMYRVPCGMRDLSPDGEKRLESYFSRIHEDSPE